MFEENGQLGFDDLEAIKEDAIDQVEDNAHKLWLRDAFSVATAIAQCKRHFTTDDIWWHLEATLHFGSTHERRAMGAVMRRVKRERLARPTNEFVQSVRPVRHRGPIRVWQSYISELPNAER